ncbi:uncharacterized protein CMU_036070 [Cryptosporidium muris RN66]|uniref:Uncharacterized protein n=1 Tax=Cryptosporidium muris (strain RN66) TaxID=441375 RepID=B6AGU3_CRYMR|nr:uncharacterized protein CMU_036070 [Cryptosporidium muris RN66]EEA07434.1 hypothetical protein, conserved [Cryptosporidium muris RN66]|eukprot:XP_002141783.1 hypothetical protein [Cryptosporidium muris RN66]
MALSLLRKVNEKVLNSVSLLDASLDVDYIVSGLRSSLNNGEHKRIEEGIISLMEFSKRNLNALLMQREWIECACNIVIWSSKNQNEYLFSLCLELLRIVTSMVEDRLISKAGYYYCCNIVECRQVDYKRAQKEDNTMMLINDILKYSNGGVIFVDSLRILSMNEKHNLNNDDCNMYSHYDVLKILYILQISRNADNLLELNLLSNSEILGTTLELLNKGLNSHGYFLSSALELTVALTLNNHSEIQKIITFQGLVDLIYNILAEEMGSLIRDKNLEINSNGKIHKFGSVKDFCNYRTLKEEELDYESPEVLSQCIECLYHIFQNSSCIKYMIETEGYKVMLNILIDLLGLCLYLCEQWTFYNEQTKSRPIKDELTSENSYNKKACMFQCFKINELEHNIKHVSWICTTLKILKINREFLSHDHSKKISSFLFETYLTEILFTVLGNPDNLHFNISYEAIEILETLGFSNEESKNSKKDQIYFVDKNIYYSIDKFSHCLEWCTLQSFTGVSPYVWYGYRDIFEKFLPSINYIFGNEAQKVQTEEKNKLKDLISRYSHQMESSLLDWLGTSIMSPYNIIPNLKSAQTDWGSSNRDDWFIMNLLPLLFNRSESFNLNYLANQSNEMFFDFVHCVFWFPMVEFCRLHSTLNLNFLNTELDYQDSPNHQILSTITLSLSEPLDQRLLACILHYRIWRTFQILQLIVLYSPNSLNSLSVVTIEDIVNKAWSLGKGEDVQTRILDSKMDHKAFNFNNEDADVQFEHPLKYYLFYILKTSTEEVATLLNKENSYLDYSLSMETMFKFSSISSCIAALQVIFVLLYQESKGRLVDFRCKDNIYIISNSISKLLKFTSLDNFKRRNRVDLIILFDLANVLVVLINVCNGYPIHEDTRVKLSDISKRLQSIEYKSSLETFNSIIIPEYTQILITKFIDEVLIRDLSVSYFSTSSTSDNYRKCLKHVGTNNNTNVENFLINDNSSKNSIDISHPKSGFANFDSNIENQYDCIECTKLKEQIFAERRYFRNLLKNKQDEVEALIVAYKIAEKEAKERGKLIREIGISYCEVSPFPIENLDDPTTKNINEELFRENQNLMEIIGILQREIPQVRQYIEDNILISRNKDLNKVLNSIDSPNFAEVIGQVIID